MACLDGNESLAFHVWCRVMEYFYQIRIFTNQLFDFNVFRGKDVVFRALGWDFLEPPPSLLGAESIMLWRILTSHSIVQVGECTAMYPRKDINMQSCME